LLVTPDATPRGATIALCPLSAPSVALFSPSCFLWIFAATCLAAIVAEYVRGFDVARLFSAAAAAAAAVTTADVTAGSSPLWRASRRARASLAALASTASCSSRTSMRVTPASA
jgi:hypothetical protein